MRSCAFARDGVERRAPARRARGTRRRRCGPPSRRGTRRATRSAISTRMRSPSAWPCVSLTLLKPSRSRKMIAPGCSCWRACMAMIARCSSAAVRLASPVSASVRACRFAAASDACSWAVTVASWLTERRTVSPSGPGSELVDLGLAPRQAVELRLVRLQRADHVVERAGDDAQVGGARRLHRLEVQVALLHLARLAHRARQRPQDRAHHQHEQHQADDRGEHHDAHGQPARLIGVVADVVGDGHLVGEERVAVVVDGPEALHRDADGLRPPLRRRRGR